MRTIEIPAWWIRGFRHAEVKTFDIFTPLSLLSVLTSLLIAGALVAGLVVGWRHRRLELVTAAVLALGLCAAVAIFTAGFPTDARLLFS